MKTLLLIVSVLFFSLPALCQKNAVIFCKLYVTTHVNREKKGEEIKVDIGADGDSTESKKIELVNGFKNDIDALNYMTKYGWELISIVCYYEPSSSPANKKEIFFKKEMKH